MTKKRTATNSRRKASKSRWQYEMAKTQFDELFRRALAEGPQWLTRQDKEAVVVVSAEEFKRLQACSPRPQNLVQFFAGSPLASASIDLERKRERPPILEF